MISCGSQQSKSRPTVASPSLWSPLTGTAQSRTEEEIEDFAQE